MPSRNNDHPVQQEEVPQKSFEMLISAINKGNVQKVRNLLESGEVTLNNSDNMAVYIACQNNSVDIVETLLRHGADANEGRGLVNDPSRLPQWPVTKPIHCACKGEGDRTELVKCLIDAGCDLNVGDEKGNTALHIASRHGNVSLVCLLVESGADVNQTKCEYETPLTIAARQNNAELLQILIDAGADPVHLCCVSLHSCIELNFPKGVEILYKACRSRACDIDLHMTRLKLMNERANLLGDDYPIIDMGNDSKDIPALHMACSSPYAEPWEVVKTILEIGADVLKKDQYGFNCLQHACSRVNVKTVKVLLDYGVNPRDHSWDKLWKAIPPFDSHRANFYLDNIRVTDYRDYLQLLKLLVLAGFKIDEESERMLTEAIKASDLSDEEQRCFTSFMTEARTVPLSLKELCRIAIRQCVRPSVDDNIGKLENRIPFMIQRYLRLPDFMNSMKRLCNPLNNMDD